MTLCGLISLHMKVAINSVIFGHVENWLITSIQNPFSSGISFLLLQPVCLGDVSFPEICCTTLLFYLTGALLAYMCLFLSNCQTPAFKFLGCLQLSAEQRWVPSDLFCQSGRISFRKGCSCERRSHQERNILKE